MPTTVPRVPLAAWVAAAVVAAPMLAAALRAQSLDARVAAAHDGVLQLRFTARPGVCGDGRGTMSTGHDAYVVGATGRGEARPSCTPGPVRVLLAVRGGAVEDVHTYVGGNDSGATDIGTVASRDAASWLLALVPRLPRRSADDAIAGAVLADSAVVWPGLLAIARDDSLARSTRASATFWVGRAAAAKLSATSFPDDTPEPDDIRSQAIFALSRQPRGEAIPALMRIARTSSAPGVRSRALFWLGQLGGPEVLRFFETILRE